MKSILCNIMIAAMTASALSASAQDYSTVDFGKGTGYTGIGVYDTWEESPFRTGTLKGNCRIVPTNDLSATEGFEMPDRLLGAQRSRFGSNTFGARIDLAQPFDLTSHYKYVHVVMNRPVSGRVMLVGIGESTDFPSNGDQVEQFWEMSLNDVKPGEWTDAVFPVKGFGNIKVKSLVVVPECESPHNLKADYPFYIASIAVNDSRTPIINNENYPVNACSRSVNIPLEGDAARRRISSVSLASASDGEQTIDLPKQPDRMLYREILDDCFTAKAGDKISMNVNYSNPSDMLAYVYIDLNNDGIFEWTPDADGAEIMAVSEDGCALPAFTLPMDVEPGIYRMRVKVDRNSPDPAGNTVHGDGIWTIGGEIIDFMINIHPDGITVNDHQLNGEVLAADKSKLNKYPADFGRDFNIVLAPEKGFVSGGVTVRYGYPDREPVVTDNPQFFEKVFKFTEPVFTIPGKYMRGNVLLMGDMIEK